MLSFSHVFVRLLTRLNDNVHSVLTTIAPSGDAMRLIVASRECACWETRITEAELQREKESLGASSAVSWASFFDMFQKAFVERSIEFNAQKCVVAVSLRHDRSTDSFPANPFTATVSFTVRVADPASLSVTSVVQALVDYMPMRLGDRKEQDRIDEASRAADILREDCERIVEECDLLLGWKNRHTREADAAEAEAAELAKLLDQCNDGDVASSWRSIVDKTPSAQVLCAVRDPLTNAPMPLNFNLNMLKLIKTTTGFHTFIGSNNSSAASHIHSPSTPTSDGGANTQHLRCCNAVPYDRRPPGGTGANSNAGSKPPSNSDDEEAVLTLLVGMDDWGNFDSLELEKACRRCTPQNEFGALFYVGYYAFMKLGLASRFNMSETTLLHFLAAMERGYDNTLGFHNSVHATDVLYCTLYVLCHAELARKSHISDVQVMALILAALAIDVDHTGISNATHAKVNSLLNIIHVGQSPTEAHHVAFVLSLLGQSRYNILDCVAASRADAIRSLTSEFVLATDPARGKAVLRHAQRQIIEGLDLNDAEQCGLVCCLCIMAADASYPVKPTHIYSRWVHGLLQEQALCVATEEALGYKVTPVNVASPLKPGGQASVLADERAATQLRYINVVTQPMFAALSEVLPALRMTGEFVAANKVLWGSA